MFLRFSYLLTIFDILFFIFGFFLRDFLIFFVDLCWFFLDFFWIFGIFWKFVDFFLHFLDFFFRFLNSFFGFFCFFGIPLKFSKFTSKSYQGYYWTPKNTKNGPKQYNKLFFCPKAKNALAEGQSPLQELEVGLHSGPYLLVRIMVLYLTQRRSLKWL